MAKFDEKQQKLYKELVEKGHDKTFRPTPEHFAAKKAFENISSPQEKETLESKMFPSGRPEYNPRYTPKPHP